MKERAFSVRIGNQTSFSASTIVQPFEYAVSNGFDAFEWFPDKRESGEGWQAGDLSGDTRAYIRDAALEHGIHLSVHAPWQANPLNPDARPYLLDAVELAIDLDASLLNIHFCTEGGVPAFVDAIMFLLERLARSGIDLSLENTPLIGPADMNELFDELSRRRLADEIQVGMCLDIGHANLCEDTRNDYIRYIDELDPQIPVIHAHIHENYGDSDSHLPLFTGPAGGNDSGVKGFVSRMKRRRFSGSFILEQWPEPPALLNRARERLLALIDGNAGPEARRSERPEPVHRLLPPIEGDDFAAEIARADRQFNSWRKKLDWVQEFLERQGPGVTVDQLVCFAIYFRFMGTGEIPFAEDGGHYRPRHHAELARRIHERLSAVTTPQNRLIVRKIYPWLPSYSSAFTRAEPLTRIRDIAHRNDIPQALKREIKTTLQNKLHRSAGPEDLVTSGRLLERLTAPDADYPAAFVKEFQRFHRELKEFFNARSLEEHLEGMLDRNYTPRKGLIRNFLQRREEARSIEEQMGVLDTLTRLRLAFHERLGESSGAEAQELEIADIKLEDYCFVLLSRFVNELEPLKNALPWKRVVQTVALVVRNLSLGGFDAEECRSTEAELEILRACMDLHDREYLLRLKAALDRSARLAETYSGQILKLFPERAERLGRLLGVADHSIKVYGEAEIRSHMVFQLSRLIAVLLKMIRTRASLPPWDLIVPGRVTGRLVETSRLGEAADSGDGQNIALLDKVEGDEEIPPGVAAMLVAQATPHLSHLAVRARQERVVFAVCEDAEIFARLRESAGKRLNLSAFQNGVHFSVSADAGEQQPDEKQRGIRLQPVILPDVELAAKQELLSLDEVTPQTGGGKAYGARRLGEFSRDRRAGFKTPPGLVIPFGVMEEALRSAPALEEEYKELMTGLNELAPAEFVRRLQKLQGTIERLPVPKAVVAGVTERFSGDDRLVVRSSSNSEDLDRLAGAGLYESFGNVEPREAASAVSRVWASLWTKRAAASRKNTGIPHERTRMAVLLQKMVVPGDLSFIMHTVNPIDHNPDEVYVELAVGLGETLASGAAAGEPFRLVCEKSTGAVRLLAFASFSRALWPDAGGGLVDRTVDYTVLDFSADKEYRDRLGARLGAIGRFIENELGQAQDVEGVVCGDDIYLVQSRFQQGEA